MGCVEIMWTIYYLDDREEYTTSDMWDMTEKVMDEKDSIRCVTYIPYN